MNRCVAFDLWGKGTQVTVIGDKKAPAYLFPLLPCGTKGGFVHLGCMASDFSPADSLSFSWKDSSSQPLQDSRQYPLLEQNGVNVGVSEIRVTAEDWEKKKPYQCTVTHPALPGGKTVILEKPGPRINISILPDLNEKEFMLECHIVTDFFPSEIYVGWRISDDRYEAGDTGKPERTGGRYTVISRLKVSKENWNKGTIYSCFAGLGSRETDKVPTMKTVNKMTGNSEEISM